MDMLTSGSITSCEISTLDHEVLDHSVEFTSLVSQGFTAFLL